MKYLLGAKTMLKLPTILGEKLFGANTMTDYLLGAIVDTWRVFFFLTTLPVLIDK